MRATLTTLIILAGLFIAVSVYFGNAPSHPPAAEPSGTTPSVDRPASEHAAAISPTPDTAPAATVRTTETAQPASAPREPVPQPTPSATEAAVKPLKLTGLHAQGAESARIAMIGSRRKADGYDLYVELSAWGASILQIDVSDYKQSVDNPNAYTLLKWTTDPALANGQNYVFAFAARAITINGQRIDLDHQKWRLVEPTDPAHFRTTLEPGDAEPGAPGVGRVTTRAVYELSIVDENSTEVAVLRRVYEVRPASHDLRIDQTIENKMDGVLNVVWEQDAQTNPVGDDAAYMGDRRMLMAGYFNLSDDPGKTNIYVDGAYISRANAIQKGKRVYPNDSLPKKTELVWAAMLNRYFALAIHPMLQRDVTGLTRRMLPTLENQWAELGQRVVGHYVRGKDDRSTLIYTLTSKPFTVGAHGVGALPISLYAGPRLKTEFNKQPYALLDFDRMIRYELGCSLFTFQPLARGLLWFLTVIHTIVRDWGVSILILVVLVRLVLHPITKKSQVNMMKMGKQMQSLQPELEKLKKRYADDSKRYQQEQMKLFREKGVNPANFLGCLPMFLQMPIWVALYAMLYFAIELLHKPAFYGVFQAFGHWSFLSDLSQPDRLIRFFPEPHTIRLLIMPLDYSSLNILPLLWGVVMVAQQHFMTPPTTNEQSAQQQKIMKWVMLLFPLMLYSAPSGLMLYILASTGAGLLDSYLVRQHIKELEASGELFSAKKPREPKPGGLRDRLQKTLAERQKQMARLQETRRPGERSKPRRKR